MSDLDLTAENERRAALLIDLPGLLNAATGERRLEGWRRVLTGLGCLYAASRTSYFPGIALQVPHRLRHQLLLADEPIALLRDGGYPMAVRFLAEEARPVTASFGTVSALLDLAAGFLEAEEIHRFLHGERAPRRRAGERRVERWLGRFLADGGTPGYLRFLDFSLDLLRLHRSMRPGEETMAELAAACFAAPYAAPDIEPILASARARLRHADAGWIEERLGAVGTLRELARRSRMAPAEIDAVLDRARAAQFDRRVAVRTQLAERKPQAEWLSAS
ncbi:MAG TPA: hypothetical protein VMU85_00665 [Stellaceae bacterium]|nr:hypothetical protein [Stellaceae bacterium]